MIEQVEWQSADAKIGEIYQFAFLAPPANADYAAFGKAIALKANTSRAFIIESIKQLGRVYQVNVRILKDAKLRTNFGNITINARSSTNAQGANRSIFAGAATAAQIYTISACYLIVGKSKVKAKDGTAVEPGLWRNVTETVKGAVREVLETADAAADAVQGGVRGVGNAAEGAGSLVKHLPLILLGAAGLAIVFRKEIARTAMKL